MFKSFLTAAVGLLLACSSTALAANLPADVMKQLPQGYGVLSSASSLISSTHRFYFVALASKKEVRHALSSTRAPARPLLIFERRASGRYALVARNDDVILRADDGGINGCDPFEERSIAVKGVYFTVEQGVACGAHWTDYVTFRFDPQSAGYVLDNWRVQSWSLNPSNDPNAEALVSDGQKVVRAKGRAVPFAKWRRPDIG
jgi:hypothetical protein